MYFSAKSDQFFLEPCLYGLMLSYRQAGGQREALEAGCLWMLDNGAFSGNFDEDRWTKQMINLSPFAEQCRGVVAPDAVILDSGGNFVRGDWKGTRDRLVYYAPFIRALGFPVAYALQDDHPPDDVPWDLFDVLFVAGTTEYKEGAAAEHIARLAIARGKRVHIGRVSSARRIRITWYADSWDGTTFRYGKRDEKMRLFREAITETATKNNQWRLL